MLPNGLAFKFDHNKLLSITGFSDQADYIINYLKKLQAKTCILENKYIDKDFLVDYQKFYSRSYKSKERITKRVHFFSETFSHEQFSEMLRKNDVLTLKKSYLGFIIIKPIRDKDKELLIGRTLLKNYPEKENSIRRRYIAGKRKLCLFGVDLEIEATPFQVQDKGVGVCATIALWTAFQALISLFNIQQRSPAEITELSTKHITESRIFPQEGLTLDQMIKCIRSLKLDVEVISAVDSDVIIEAVKAYVNAGIPPIATLKLSNKKETEYHAAVIVGFQRKNGNITEFYVHDDQIGPYSRAKPYTYLKITNNYLTKTIEDFRFWDNEWKEKYSKVELEKLLIPIYHKIRLPWHTIYELHTEYKEVNEKINNKAELFLYTIQGYKKWILNQRVKAKIKTLKMNLPRFIWVERISNKKTPIVDYLFDGTATYVEQLSTVKYL